MAGAGIFGKKQAKGIIASVNNISEEDACDILDIATAMITNPQKGEGVAYSNRNLRVEAIRGENDSFLLHWR